MITDKFDGIEFKTWHKKMFFLWKMLKLEKYLIENRHVLSPQKSKYI